jgi:hypothetical protein
MLTGFVFSASNYIYESVNTRDVTQSTDIGGFSLRYHLVYYLRVQLIDQEVTLLMAINILVRYGGMGGFPC